MGFARSEWCVPIQVLRRFRGSAADVKLLLLCATNSTGFVSEHPSAPLLLSMQSRSRGQSKEYG